MTDKFERHGSTRWTKANVPSYGEDWGDDYVIEEASASQEELPKQHNPTPAKLVLSIDNIPNKNDSDSDLENDSEGQKSNAAYPYPQSTPREPSPLHSSHPLSQTVPSRSGHGIKDDSDYFPPTPTFTNHSSLPPDTPALDRSFISDTDLIQHEPASLNLATGGLHEIREEPSRGNAAPESLVLSIDRLSGVHDRDDDDTDDDSDISFQNNLGIHRSLSDASKRRSFHFDHVPALVSDLDSDDWGYNPKHSSNDEAEKEDGSQADDEFGHLRTLPPSVGVRQPVKTDALDSLINDLLMMERLHTLSTAKQEEGGSANGAQSEEFPKVASQPIEEESHDGEPSQLPTDESHHELPSLGSIHDHLLPDFDGRSFTSDTPSNRASILPDDYQKEHEKFLSNVRSRSSSVRKPPQDKAAVSLLELALYNEDEENTTGVSDPARDLAPPQLEPVASSGSVSTGKMSFDMAAPGKLEDPSVSRRVSTTLTLNMGSWTPDTNIYRDRFVNDNDNESQMNMSVFNGNEGNYMKFTGLRAPSVYAELFTNSLCISVPDTIDAGLPSIAEQDVDDDGNGDAATTMPDIVSMRDGDTDTNPSPSTFGSVLKDRPYHQPAFKEESTPAALRDCIPEEPETGEENDAELTPETDVESKRVISGSGLSDLAFLELPSKQKYPVSDWKKIMAQSQPIDRINLLREALIKEAAYETGLQHWLYHTLKSTELNTHMQIGKLASEAYQNAPHNDLRRHTSIRSKVSLVKDKIDTGSFGRNLQKIDTGSFGRKIFGRSKKTKKGE